ncbi:unnamed protein product [Rhizoctonia solani]|uniref:MYND-type domain-containing protein n=1 Tax=Rhizoctonia solani TaxID=456999 RepID=A0A8H3C870_9AGAM|nr:unnamed protein product [Rhizoctonia solani]
MSTIPNIEFHGLWGRTFPNYFESYTNQALAVPLSAPDELDLRAKAAEIIQWIVILGAAPKNITQGLAKLIPMSMLKLVLEATKIPEEISRLANPRLVAGCVELMASVEPLFGYERGYVCFRILNLAISACMLKRAGRLDTILQRMSSVSESHLLFWEDTAALAQWDIRRGGRIALGLCPDFTANALDRLIELLHVNQKQYFITLKALGSMGLSGLMLILRAHIQVERVPISSNTNSGDLVESLVQPYSRLLWRYLLVVPSIKHESQAIYEIHVHITHFARCRDSYFIDVEDSRNLLQALNEYLVSSSTIRLAGGMILLRFVEPLVVPGCEDLVPVLVERSLRLMWSSILDDGPGSSTVQTLVTNALTCIRYIFQEIRPKTFSHQQWIVKLVDAIIDESLTDLVLRVLVAAPDFIPGQQDVIERLYHVASQVYEELVHIAPKSYLTLRLNDSGTLVDWQKYIFHFIGAGDVLRPTASSSLHSISKACGEVIIHTVVAVFAKEGTSKVYSVSGSCDNLRCAMPCDAAYICSECVDLVYCGVVCLTADWTAPWQGLHKRFCKQKTMVYLRPRASYHRVFEVLGHEGFDLIQRSDMDVQKTGLSYHCDNAEWRNFY